MPQSSQAFRTAVVLALVASVFLIDVPALAQTQRGERPPAHALAARDTMLRLRPHRSAIRSGIESSIDATISSGVSSCFEWKVVTAGEQQFRFFAPPVYDSARHRAIRFGGIGWGSGLSNDVWVQDLDSSSGWTRLTTSGTPPSPRHGHCTIYDPVRDRLIIFGGDTGSCDPEYQENCIRNDVWALSLSGAPTWQQIPISGPSPTTRWAAAVIYDPVRDRMIVSGGNSDDYLDDNCWALSLTTATWTQLPSGPNYFMGGGFYDAIRDRMLLLSPQAPGIVWTLDLSGSTGWTSVTPTGSLPPRRERSALVYDPVRDRVFMFGGATSEFLDDFWELTLSGTPAWNQVSASRVPPARWNCSGFYDVANDRMAIFGGSSINAYADTWVFPFAGPLAWSRLFPVEFAPTPRNEQGIVWDAPRRRMIVFGGQGPEGASLNDTYALDVSGAPAWTRIDPLGPLPETRVSMTAITDANDRLIVFGGRSEGRPVPGTRFLNDVWALSLTGPPVWTAVTPSGEAPSGRSNACAAYDPVRNRMIVFGGGDNVAYMNDAWALDLTGATAWQQLTPAGTPPPPMGSAEAVYDPVRDRVLVIGGYRTSIGGINTVWALSLAGSGEWTMVSPAGDIPPLMNDAPAVYDGAGDRVLVYAPTGEVAILSLAGTPTWTVAGIVGEAPVDRIGHGGVFDPDRGRMIVFGGADWREFVYLNDAVELTVAADASPLAISADPIDGGSVTRDPVSDCYANGAVVTLTATPATGNRFAGWSGDATGKANPLTVTMDAAKNIVARFEPGPTATLLSRFEAKSAANGIELRWELGAPELVAVVVLERAPAEAGPWRAVTSEREAHSGPTRVLDGDAAPGREYWYRLNLALRAGGTLLSPAIPGVFDPIRESDITAVTPNPNLGFARVDFAVARAGLVRLAVFDVTGRSVVTLLDAEQRPGRYAVEWNARGTARVPAGIYFIRLSTPDRDVVRRIAFAP